MEKEHKKEKRKKPQKFRPGAFVMTAFPNTEEIVAVLRVRGQFSKRHGRPEPYPGSCQITIQTECKKGQSHEPVLERAFEDILGICEVLSGAHLVRLNRKTADDTVYVNYCVFLPFELLEKATVSAFDGGIRFVKESDLNNIVDVRAYPIKDGVNDRSVTAMFPDEILALRSAFNRYKKLGKA